MVKLLLLIKGLMVLENGLKQEHCGLVRLPNGIEYYVVSDNMDEKDLISVASSVATIPVSK